MSVIVDIFGYMDMLVIYSSDCVCEPGQFALSMLIVTYAFVHDMLTPPLQYSLGLISNWVLYLIDCFVSYRNVTFLSQITGSINRMAAQTDIDLYSMYNHTHRHNSGTDDHFSRGNSQWAG
jgi:hypothetical protein